MIITRSPLRITLGGGGTDLPSYYQLHEGFVLSATIDKYVYVALTKPFVERIILKYTEVEQVERLDDIQHPIIRECLRLVSLEKPQIEIASFADVPQGTGLGSSGSFTTALFKGLYAYQHRSIDAKSLAELACFLEMKQLQCVVGKQDQYAAALGGINCMSFHKNEEVSISPLAISLETQHELEDRLLLFFTGYSRSAQTILEEQDKKSQQHDAAMIDNLNYIKRLGIESKEALERGNLNAFGALMDEHWRVKKQRSPSMSYPNIDEWYDHAMANGALGGKLVGAGGGGFLMFLAEDKDKLRAALKQIGLNEIRFRFEFSGTAIILSS
jgi:D-glycero-alpha-D-manno-heptose-7-phosphate kinase